MSNIQAEQTKAIDIFEEKETLMTPVSFVSSVKS